ncbi:MAG: hypothetical protein ACREO6_01245, partial [Rudaea sp.]
MPRYLIADNNNLWIEGQAAAAAGFPEEVQGIRPIDSEWHLDFGKFVEFCGMLNNGTQHSAIFVPRSYARQSYLRSIFNDVLVFANHQSAAEVAYGYV